MTIKGTITAYKDYATLEGVNVVIKNTTKGTSTDINGKFILTNVPRGSMLVIGRVDYDRKQILLTDSMAVNDTVTLNVVLNEKNVSLNEVVVVGYGELKKKDVTGSVSSVNMDDLEKAPVKSFDDALAGRVAGVQVVSPDGQPGGSPNIVIRGNNSITQDNSPLYVVDGFPIEDPDNNVLNPSDIESITILKDASATAIYGSRAANGVVVVTTKKGKVGSPVITYNSYYGQQDNIKLMDLMNPYQFVQYQIALLPSSAIPEYTPGDSVGLAGLGLLTDYKPGGLTLNNYKSDPGTNWQSLIYHTGKQSNNDLAIRGGTDKTRYSISGNIFDQTGTIINTGFQRYQGRMVLDQTVNKKLKVGINTNYTHTKTYGVQPVNYGGGSASRSLLYSVWGYRPITIAPGDTQTIFDPIDPGASGYSFNPVLNAQNTLLETFSNTLVSNAYATYNITDKLVFRVSGGLTSITNKSYTFYNSLTNYGDTMSSQGLTGPNGTIMQTESYDFLNENTLTYSNIWGKNSFNALGGFTAQQYSISNFGYYNVHVPNEQLGIAGLSQGIPLATYSGASNNFLESYIARINYGYDSRYLFTASFRADGSSKFAPGNKWGYFPSGAFAWNFNKETFMQKLTFVDESKLRISYGTTGNNRVTDFAYLATVTEPYANYYSFGNSYVIGAVPATLQNNNLTWETTAQTDIGIDLAFFKERILFTADYYYKKTTNLLVNEQLPPNTGFASAYENIGSVSNSGWEYSITSNNVRGRDFQWSTSFNISFNKNKVLSLANGQQSILTEVPWTTGANTVYPYIAEVGQPIGMFYGYEYAGVYQYSDFNKLSNGTYVLKSTEPTNGNPRSQIQPGDAKFVDLNGDGQINASDRTIIGNPNPLFIGGFTNNFSYKGFDLSVFFQFSYGNQILNANRILFEGSRNVGQNEFASEANAWTPTNQNTDIPRVGGIPGSPYPYSNFYLEDGSYLRLKTVSLGYNIPARLLHRIKIQKLRFYVSGQNLWTWTKYSGSDPEVSTANSALTPGFDYAAYPRARTMVIGLNLTF